MEWFAWNCKTEAFSNNIKFDKIRIPQMDVFRNWQLITSKKSDKQNYCLIIFIYLLQRVEENWLTGSCTTYQTLCESIPFEEAMDHDNPPEATMFRMNKKSIIRCRDDERVEVWNRWTLEKEHVKCYSISTVCKQFTFFVIFILGVRLSVPRRSKRPWKTRNY